MPSVQKTIFVIAKGQAAARPDKITVETPRFARGDRKRGLGVTEKRLGVAERWRRLGLRSWWHEPSTFVITGASNYLYLSPEKGSVLENSDNAKDAFPSFYLPFKKLKVPFFP